MARKRKVDEKPKEIGLNVLYKGYTDITREATGEEYDKDDTHTSWYVDGVCLKEEYPELTACFPVEVGSVVHIVYAVYSTADSFGREDDGRIVFVDVFATAEKASAAAKKIREHADWDREMNSYSPRLKKTKKELAEFKKKFASSYEVDIVRENGETMSVHVSWTGYFESLSYVEVASFVVDAGKRQRY